MGDSFGRWSSPPSQSEHGGPSLLRHSNSFARPSGKSIYNQRKDYGKNLLKTQSNFQHHVEHLLTVTLEREIRSFQDCLERLKVLEAQGRVWGQDLILQVKDQELVLRDVESKEELEAYPLGSVQGCWASLDICSYDSVLGISLQETSPPTTTVLLFQCERPGAELLKSNLEKLVKQWREEQRSHYGHRSSPDMPPSTAPPYLQGPYTVPEQWAEPLDPDFHSFSQRRLLPSEYSLHDPQQTPQTNTPSPVMSDADRDVEILNQVLGDLDLFLARLRAALGSGTTDLKKKKKKKRALPPREEFLEFFQKVKQGLNLLGRNRQHFQQPDPHELLRLIFVALSFTLEHCPDPHLAQGVGAPTLVPEAVEMLEESLPQPDYELWKSLGMAWNTTRAEYNTQTVPHDVPVFSEGWSPPLPRDQWMPTGPRDLPEHRATPSPVVRALYEFQGRNPQELSIRMGDELQVLDQRKKWWLVQDRQGDKGYVPSNILEPLGGPEGGPGQESPPNLHPDSSPAEVTAWLKDKGFSRITVRCLGVLRGHQLLELSPEDLRAICPEEWRRVLFKLSSVRTSLGMGPRD